MIVLMTCHLTTVVTPYSTNAGALFKPPGPVIPNASFEVSRNRTPFPKQDRSRYGSRRTAGSGTGSVWRFRGGMSSRASGCLSRTGGSAAWSASRCRAQKSYPLELWASFRDSPTLATPAHWFDSPKSPHGSCLKREFAAGWNFCALQVRLPIQRLKAGQNRNSHLTTRTGTACSGSTRRTRRTS